MRLRSLSARVTAAAVASLLAATLRAQGTVGITVRDAAGLPAAFVEVSLEPTEGATVALQELTDEAGRIVFLGVAGGTYRAHAFTDGFVSEVIEGLEVAAGSRQDLELHLVSAGVMSGPEILVVAADEPVVESKSSAISETITDDDLEARPLISRDVEGVIASAVGVTRMGDAETGSLSIGGGLESQIALRVDGASLNDPVSGGFAADIPMAAIENVVVTTAGGSAQVGEQSTGSAQFTTKSGTEKPDFLYEIAWRDARRAGSSVDGLEAVADEVDRLLRADGTLLETTVRDGFRLLGVDPVSTTEDDSNPPPRSRLEQTVSAGGSFVPSRGFFHVTLLDRSDDFGSAFDEGIDEQDQIAMTSKLDWLVRDAGGVRNEIEVTAIADVSDDSGFVGLQAERSTALRNSRSYWSLVATDRHVRQRPESVLLTRLQITRLTQAVRPEDVATGVGTQYLVPLPPGGFVAYALGAANRDADQTVTTARVECSRSRSFGKGGRHLVDVGITADNVWLESSEESGDVVTDLRIAADAGTIGAQANELLAGRATTFGPPVLTSESGQYASVHLTDDWRVTEHLTIAAGLRAEVQSFVKGVALSPRFGFSLDPAGKGRTRFFGNWGVYHDRVFLAALRFAGTPDRFTDDIRFARGAPDRGFDESTIREIHEDSLSRDREPQDTTGRSYQQHLYHDRFVLSDDLAAPRVRDWSFGVSQAVGKKAAVEVSYRANERTRLPAQDLVVREVATEPNEYTVRDVIYQTTGQGAFRSWTLQVSRTVGQDWLTQLSYVQSKNTGPISRPLNPIDPDDVLFGEGTRPDDRTHVVKLHASGWIGPRKLAIRMGSTFTWQSGLPYTPTILTRSGTTLRPLGDNTARQPPTRQLDVTLSREFRAKTAEGAAQPLSVSARLNVFNLLGTLNVVSGLGRFETPPGSANPESQPPLRPDFVVTGVDVGRSVELAVAVRF